MLSCFVATSALADEAADAPTCTAHGKVATDKGERLPKGTRVWVMGLEAPVRPARDGTFSTPPVTCGFKSALYATAPGYGGSKVFRFKEANADAGTLTLRTGKALRGTVRDVLHRVPRGATVRARWLFRVIGETRVRRDGSFRLPGCPNFDMCGIEAVAKGYAAANTGFRTGQPAGMVGLDPQNLNLVLNAGYRLTGTVDFGDGPVAGVEVELGTERTKTDEAGAFAFDHAPPQHASVRVEHPDGDLSETVSLVKGGAAAVELVREPQHELKVRVVDHAGEPLPPRGGSVSFYWPRATGRSAVTTGLDDEGRAELRLAPGAIGAKVRALGSLEMDFAVDFDAAAGEVVELRLPERFPIGYDDLILPERPEGARPPQLEFEVTSVFETFPPKVRLTEHTKGPVLLPAGWYKVSATVHQPKYQIVSVYAEVPLRGKIDLTEAADDEVRGRVLAPTGKPIADVEVCFGYRTATGCEWSARTGPDGAFSVKGLKENTHFAVSVAGVGAQVGHVSPGLHRLEIRLE